MIVRLAVGSLRVLRCRHRRRSTRHRRCSRHRCRGTTTVTPPPLDDAFTAVGSSTNSRRTPPPLDDASACADSSSVAVMPPPLERRCRSPVAPSMCTPPPEEPMSSAPCDAGDAHTAARGAHLDVDIAWNLRCRSRPAEVAQGRAARVDLQRLADDTFGVRRLVDAAHDLAVDLDVCRRSVPTSRRSRRRCRCRSFVIVSRDRRVERLLEALPVEREQAHGLHVPQNE